MTALGYLSQRNRTLWWASSFALNYFRSTQPSHWAIEEGGLDEVSHMSPERLIHEKMTPASFLNFAAPRKQNRK